jgi:hypothetical protein
LVLSVPVFGALGSPSGHSDKGFESPFINDVFVISIGVNYTDKMGLNLYCEFCENDAAKFSERMAFEHTISRIGKVSPKETRIYQYTLIGKDANTEKLQQAFDSIELLAQPNDAVIFFYSGVSTPGFDENYEIVNQFLLNEARVTKDSIIGPVLSMKRLKFWLNKVRARYQMMVLDAGQSDYYMPEFFKSMSVQSEYSLEVNNRKRVFIYPMTHGFDFQPDSSGMLSHILSKLDSGSSVIELFTEPKFDKSTELKIRSLEKQIKGRSPFARNRLFNGYIQIFKEWEFASQFGFLFDPADCRMPVSYSRGGVSKRLEVAKGEVKTAGGVSMKNYAILIATNDYENLNNLNNPVYDARALAQVLQKDYGFHTILLTDASEEEVSNQLMKIKDTIQFGPYDQLLVFIAGHGLYSEDFEAGFVAFSDSRPTDEDRFMKSYLQFHQLVQFIENFNCNHSMLIMDVCHGGSIRDASIMNASQCRTTSAINWNDLYAELEDAEFIQRSMECPVRRYLTSGTYSYEVPDGHPGEHSPFCKKLIEALSDTDKSVISSLDIVSRLQRLSPQPGYGRFGSDVQTSEFLFIRTREK